MRAVITQALGPDVAGETLSLLDATSDQLRFRPNELVYAQDSAADGIFVVCHGCILLEWKAHNGYVAALRLATAGQSFGHRSFCAGEPRSTEARCVSSALVLHLPSRVICNAASTDPDFYRILARLLGRDEGPKLSKVARNGRTPVRQRLAYVLATLTARLQSSAVDDGTVWFEFPLKQKDLSNLLDVTHETVSRCLHELEHEELLRVEHSPRRLWIRDPAELELIAAGRD